MHLERLQRYFVLFNRFPNCGSLCDLARGRPVPPSPQRYSALSQSFFLSRAYTGYGASVDPLSAIICLNYLILNSNDSFLNFESNFWYDNLRCYFGYFHFLYQPMDFGELFNGDKKPGAFFTGTSIMSDLMRCFHFDWILLLSKKRYFISVRLGRLYYVFRDSESF